MLRSKRQKLRCKSLKCGALNLHDITKKKKKKITMNESHCAVVAFPVPGGRFGRTGELEVVLHAAA